MTTRPNAEKERQAGEQQGPDGGLGDQPDGSSIRGLVTDVRGESGTGLEGSGQHAAQRRNVSKPHWNAVDLPIGAMQR